MLVSIVIPTKQRPQPLRDAVQSVFRSVYQNFELFVVDQSPDDTSALMLEPFWHDPRFHYLLNRRPGFGAASSRNLGIAASRGDIIALIDDDVEVQPDWLAQIVAEFSADPELDFIAGKLTAPPYDPDSGYTPAFEAWPYLSRWHFPLHASGANFSMRRRLFDRVGGYDEFCGPGSRLRASDDTDLCWRVVRSGARYKICPHIEVVHTHGFRSHAEAETLFARYQYGNGGNFGRFTRRGDLFAGAWFLAREVKRILSTLPETLRGDRRELFYAGQRLRGFWDGFRLPPHEGFVSGEQLRRLHADARAAEVPLAIALRSSSA
ncbi:glycosyltransferase family 2 protein [Chloroflexus islandicus]|uniref:glycosyltransferase family 2 protein n=1 Tax=Chloroflexus islandicus TaxID=1707952 RepID=UPI0009EE74E2|nr:glycosyltransferase [Chloroflexus islandicus]